MGGILSLYKHQSHVSHTNQNDHAQTSDPEWIKEFRLAYVHAVVHPENEQIASLLESSTEFRKQYFNLKKIRDIHSEDFLVRDLYNRTVNKIDQLPGQDACKVGPPQR